MIEIELDGAADTGQCVCCGHVSRCVWGYAHQDGVAIAAYFVHWTIGSVSAHGANFDFIIGAWGEDTSAADRVGVSLGYFIAENARGFSVINAADRPFADSPLIGALLDRDAVIDSPTARIAFDLADAIWLQDDRIAEICAAAEALREPACYSARRRDADPT